MRNLIAFPLLALAIILQSSVVSQIKLISGYADLMLIILAAWALQERVEVRVALGSVGLCFCRLCFKPAVDGPCAGLFCGCLSGSIASTAGLAGATISHV